MLFSSWLNSWYYKPLPGRIKDYIALPKPNGYRSLHTTIITETGSIIEIKYVQKKCTTEAEYGLAAHFMYKSKSPIENNEQYAWIKELRDMQTNEENTWMISLKSQN